ncbi:MAG: exodeoxyribonuclease VII small subunit [Candidatus Marinimicrobia bacterium]|nr:exodeoxyribonuclease VII small subunit [Candidatus Neomarinimicrobiota bacterium]MBL7010164.1 exodeoxyribonuclease VII small subunit [Candidatus Neomarinimicrobiota bacterium]MBL7030429.1 exodeoxyribonuclease VII small subunit [Candidatus Neomarinimicrobiota bacterium]
MTKQKNLDFESALRRLEEIVTSLEGENESLEKSLSLFEEGVNLTESLRSHLDSAEQRIQVLMKDTDGNVSTKDFEG